MNKKITITGGAGYVGIMLCRELLERGYQVTVIDNLMFGQEAFGFLFSYPNFNFIQGDITEKLDVERAIDEANIIFHLAALVGVSICRQKPHLAEHININGTKNIANLKRPEQKLVYAGTISVYGDKGGYCTEETPPSPNTIYGRTKYEGEQYVMEKENILSLRFATVYGLSLQKERSGYLMLNDFIREITQKHELIVFDKHFKRAFVHIKDAVASYLFAIENFEKMKGQIYNVGNESDNLTKEQLAQKIQSVFDPTHKFNLFFKEGTGEDNRDYSIKFNKINNLGFKTAYSVNDGIREMLNAFHLWREKLPPAVSVDPQI